MSDDASLDEFLDADDAASGDGDAAGTPTDADGSESPSTGDADAVDPATATATWSPDGAPCAACGDVVERRWRDGDGFVCGDCKGW